MPDLVYIWSATNMKLLKYFSLRA